MYRTLIVLPDGTELFSGVDQANVIQSCTITYSSNDGDDLMLGSVCAACLEAKVFSSAGDFSVAIGDVLTVYKVDDDGNRTQIGVFNVEVPTKVTKHIYKITAYDNVRKLDVDMTEWLRGLTGWPYSLTAFYKMVCEECGLTGTYSTWGGASDFQVHQFDVEKSVTGRQLVSWCAEVMGDYCIARSDGALSCNWYRTSYFYLYPSEKSMPSGHEGLKQLYHQGSLSYKDFEVQNVNIVQLRKDDSEDAELWPDYSNLSVDKTNPYIITGNPILLAHPTYMTSKAGTNTAREALEEIAERFDHNVYRPYKVEIPEFLEAQIGRYAFVTCAEGTFIAPITSLVWTGHKMKLECTARKTRQNTDSPEYKTNKQLMDHADQAAKKEAQKAVSSVGAESPDYPGCYCRTVDGETEWINPPMEPGVEYRTTERYQGKPVYVRLVNFGALPNASTNEVASGATSSANVVEWSGVISTTSGNAVGFPMYSSADGTLLAIAYIKSNGAIFCKTYTDQHSSTAKFTVRYIKE